MSNIVHFSNTSELDSLYCFPFAGGAPSVYFPLSESLNGIFNISAINFPGKGVLIGEPSLKSMDQLMEYAFSALEYDRAFDKPYYIMGYSLGSKVATMLIEKIAKQGLPLPRKVYLCASEPPNCKTSRKPSKGMSDDEFIELLKSMNGTSNDILDNKELMDIYLPSIRADFNISDSFYKDAPDRPFCVEAVIIYGNYDHFLSSENIELWSKFYNKTSFFDLEEGHFFLTERPSLIKEIIISSIDK